MAFPWVNSQQRWSPTLNGDPNDDRQGGDNKGAAEEGAFVSHQGLEHASQVEVPHQYEKITNFGWTTWDGLEKIWHRHW